jgi:predicted GIY-YIG superfamily endonuclease
MATTTMNKNIFTKKLVAILLIVLLTSSVDARRSSRRSSSGGTYRYVKKGRTLYVGTTNNFKRRHAEHRRDHAYARGAKYITNKMPKSTPTQRYAQEKRDIAKYKPVNNKIAGGNGP